MCSQAIWPGLPLPVKSSCYGGGPLTVSGCSTKLGPLYPDPPARLFVFLLAVVFGKDPPCLREIYLEVPFASEAMAWALQPCFWGWMGCWSDPARMVCLRSWRYYAPWCQLFGILSVPGDAGMLRSCLWASHRASGLSQVYFPVLTGN